jgi:hypothetical protein
MRAARVVTTWTTAAGGVVGVPLALAASKPALAVAFYACAHSWLSRVSRTRSDAFAALAWAACAAGACASTSSFSACALQVAPALAAHAHARAVAAFRSELLTVVKAGREAAVDCARTFAQRIRAGNANAKSALDDVANESFFLIDEHVGKVKHSETDYRSAFKARRTAAGVLLVGVLTALLFAATGAPVAHSLGVAAVSASAAAATTAASADAPSRLGEEGSFAVDEEVAEVGERAAAAVRAGSKRESYVVFALVAVACVGASLDAAPLAVLAVTTIHFAGGYTFALRGTAADAAPAFLGVLAAVLIAS